MNRKDLRSRIMTLRSRAISDNDTTTIAQMNDCIDLAYKRLANECPSALIPDEEHCVLLQSYTSESTGARITKTTDTKVMEFTPVPTLLVPSIQPATDGTWDGIYHLEITDVGGQVHRRQCREFWSAQDLFQNVTNNYVSIDRPWPAHLTGNLKFRLVAPEFYTSDDVMEILSGQIWDGSKGVMFPISSGYVHYMGRNEIMGDQTGRPSDFYRENNFQLDAPNRAPLVSTIAEQVWTPEAVGKFDYCFTYVWGRKDEERLDPSGTYDPQWESSPSPVSASISPTLLQTVLISLPNIDWELGFDVVGTLRKTHSGLRKRIYRRRYTVGAGTVTALESPEVFQFLAEVDGATLTYTDTGADIPGYFRRLPEVHGYYTWKATPLQDKRYEVDLRVLRRPRSLANDYDAPKISVECIDALIMLGCYYFAQLDSDPENTTRYEQEAIRMIQLYRGRHGNPVISVEAIPWSSSAWGTNRHYIGKVSI